MLSSTIPTLPQLCYFLEFSLQPLSDPSRPHPHGARSPAWPEPNSGPCPISQEKTLNTAPHHFAQFGIRAARRRDAGLRFAASALFSVHLISGFVRQRLVCLPDCNFASVRREAFLHHLNSRLVYSRNAPFACRGDRRRGAPDRRSRLLAIDPICRREALVLAARSCS